MAYNILLMGASYGSLLASKMLFGGHKIHLVCLPAEAELINKEGFRVRMPIRGRKDPVVLDSRELPGQVTAGGAEGVNPADYDLVGLCMQEPQYRVPAVKDLLDKVAKSRVPCMSIMNMPPLPYIKRIPGLDYAALEAAYTDARVWDSVNPANITLNSPDPQAIRPPGEPANMLMVTLPTNFKCAAFQDPKRISLAYYEGRFVVGEDEYVVARVIPADGRSRARDSGSAGAAGGDPRDRRRSFVRLTSQGSVQMQRFLSMIATSL